MANNVEFIDNSVQVSAALDAAILAYLHEAGGELEAQVKRGTKVSTGELKNSWEYKVNGEAKTATVGSPLERAIWNEFGTGEYAVNGDGRKGYWVFVKGSDGQRSTSPKTYTLQEAKRIVAFMRDEGLDAYYTKGMKPQHTLQTAFNSSKSTLIRRAEQILKGRME